MLEKIFSCQNIGLAEEKVFVYLFREGGKIYSQTLLS